MSSRVMARDINNTSVQRNCLKNEIGEIHFHGGFGCFLQIGRSHDFQWDRHDREEDASLPSP